MSPEERHALVDAYIERYAKRIVLGKDNVFLEQDINPWAPQRFIEIGEDDPELTWELILLIFEKTSDPAILGMVAAGPLEDLVDEHGPLFIDRIEEQAKSNPVFKEALHGVWRSSTREIWARVEAVRA